MDLAPFLRLVMTQTVAGCQGFIGPLPSAFLDKHDGKNCRKDRGTVFRIPNLISKYFKNK
jgi:hypothetical protein